MTNDLKCTVTTRKKHCCGPIEDALIIDATEDMAVACLVMAADKSKNPSQIAVEITEIYEKKYTGMALIFNTLCSR